MTTPNLPESDEALAALLREAARDPAAPADVLARAIAIRSPAHEMARKAGEVLRRLIAAPVFAAAGDVGVPVGVRAAGPSPRHLLFRAEEYEVDVRVTARGAAWTVTGQVFGTHVARHVVLSAAAEAPRTAELGPTAEFCFVGLAPGRYELTVKTPELDIVIPALEVGAVPRQ